MPKTADTIERTVRFQDADNPELFVERRRVLRMFQEESETIISFGRIAHEGNAVELMRGRDAELQAYTLGTILQEAANDPCALPRKEGTE